MRQRGAVAIMVAVSLLVLLGMFGLAVDSGRLYINKSELQSAADSCALAASQELNCQPVGATPCAATFLQKAEAAGTFAAGRNRAQLQGSAVTIAPGDVRFSTTLGPNSAYLARAAGANPNSRFVMCIARADDIAPWVMGVIGVGDSDVSAIGVATLAPGQTFCSNAPIGVCQKAGGSAPNFGYSVGEWIAGNFTASGGGNGPNDSASVTGGFRWVDFTPNAGGNSEIREQLAGRSQVCGLQVGGNVQQPGTQQGAKLTYNTRFGVYANGSGETATSAPPDYTGYAYPNRAPGSPVIPVGTSAYANYVTRQNANTPFIEAQYGGTGQVAVGQDVVSTMATHIANGSERRLIAVPVIACGTGTVPMLGLACVLMLNPMSKGNNGTVYLEYRGNAADGTSPCRNLGLTGGPGTNGPLVPTLVQ